MSRPQQPALSPIRAIGQRRMLLTDLYHQVLVRSWRDFVLFALLSFLCLNALFALVYQWLGGAISGAHDFQDHFFFSVQTLCTIGYGTMAPQTLAGHVVVTLEAFTGILCVAMITGLTFAKVARPSARVLFSEKIAAPTRHGVPHLQFRMANQRQNLVVEASARVIVLIAERTPEGETLRRPVDIKLVRTNTPLFALTWTAMHTIDEHSPFHGEIGAVMDRLRAQKAEIYVSLAAYDETVAQTIHARHRYSLDDIAWGMRYVDVLATLDDGTRVIDYTHFHEVTPVTVPVPAPEALKTSSD